CAGSSERPQPPQRPIAREAGGECNQSRQPGATLGVLEWHVLGVHAEEARDQRRRQQTCRQNRKREQSPVRHRHHLGVEFIKQQTRAIVQRSNLMVYRVELLCEDADSTGYLRIVNRQPWFEAMKHAAKLSELPVYAHRLQANASDTLAFVVRLLVQDVIFGAVKFISERFSHARNGISKLVDNGIEKRYGGREAFSAFDGPSVAFDRMRRTLASGYQHA